MIGSKRLSEEYVFKESVTRKARFFEKK